MQLFMFKLSYFLLYGSYILIIFTSIFLKEQGVTKSQLAMALLVCTFVEIFAFTVNGIIADKIGRCKPILIVHLLLCCVVINILLLLPELQSNPIVGKTNTNVGFSMEQQKLDFVFNSSYDEVPQLTYYNTTTTENHTSLRSSNISSEKSIPHTWILLILYLLFHMEISTSFNFIDIMAKSVSSAYSLDYGKIRFWGVFGMIIVSPLIGYVVNISSIAESPKNFTNAVYVFDALLAVIVFFLWKVQVEGEPPGRNMWKKAFHLMKQVDVVVFYLILMTLGTAFITFQNYMPLYLNEMGASALLIALLPAISCLSGLPFLHTSEWWIKKLGNENIFLVALIIYALMNLGYYLIENVWFALLIHTGLAFSFHLLFVVLIKHCNEIAPPGLKSTVMTTALASHFSVGEGVSGLIGGLTFDSLGARCTVGIIGVICAATALFAGMFFQIRKKQKKLLRKTSEKVFHFQQKPT